MYKKTGFITALAVVGLLLPQLSFAGDLDDEVQSLHTVLEGIYNEMIPKAQDMIGVARAIAGFAAIFYIGARVWRHIANAEPVDFYPLLRPFAIGIAIGLYPTTIAIVNGILKPTETATYAMVENSNKAIEILMKQKEEALKNSTVWKAYVGESGSGDRAEWYKFTHPDDPTGSNEAWYHAIGNSMQFMWEKALYQMKNKIKVFMSEVLSILYAAAALCINTLRTFYMIVLVMVGPFVLAFATFDGFTNGLANWIGRYINVFLWLPVANIFSAIIGKIQENMLKIDIAQVKQYGDSFFSVTDAGYLIFMVIAIVGYTTVPSVANYIVQASGASAILRKVTNMSTSVASTAGGLAGGVAAGAGAVISAPLDLARGYAAGNSGMYGGNSPSLSNNIGSHLGRSIAGALSPSENDTQKKADNIKGPKEG